MLPGALLFGAGLTLMVAPLTSTVMAAPDQRHVGSASGVNNAVARTAQLLAVAVLPLVAGISGEDYADADAFTSGWATAARVAAGLLLAGGVYAWLFLRDDVLDEDDDEGRTTPAATTALPTCRPACTGVNGWRAGRPEPCPALGWVAKGVKRSRLRSRSVGSGPSSPAVVSLIRPPGSIRRQSEVA